MRSADDYFAKAQHAFELGNEPLSWAYLFAWGDAEPGEVVEDFTDQVVSQL